jgi:hypothetical protein
MRCVLLSFALLVTVVAGYVFDSNLPPRFQWENNEGSNQPSHFAPASAMFYKII